MAGNTDAIPAAVIHPARPNATPQAMAAPAPRPRSNNTRTPTRRFPLGAGGALRQARTPNTTVVPRATTPTKTSRFMLGESASRTTTKTNAAMIQKPSDRPSVSISAVDRSPARMGQTRQTPKNAAFSNMPRGMADIAVAKTSARGSAWKSPNEAGTTVKGRVPRMPPSCPPKRSIAKVTNMAAKAAASPGIRMGRRSFIDEANTLGPIDEKAKLGGCCACL